MEKLEQAIDQILKDGGNISIFDVHHNLTLKKSECREEILKEIGTFAFCIVCNLPSVPCFGSFKVEDGKVSAYTYHLEDYFTN